MPPSLRVALTLVVGAGLARLTDRTVVGGAPAVLPLLVVNGAVAIVAVPALVVIAAFPATFAYWRVGPSAADVSLADAVLVLSIMASLRYVPWHSSILRRLLAGLALYEALLVISLVSDFSDRAFAEWVHRGVLVGGSIIVGAVIGRHGLTRSALRSFVTAGAIVAVAAVIDSVSNGFEPGYPFGIQKNAAGLLLACGVVVSITAASEIALGRRTHHALRLLLFAGLLATQSRGAMVALIAATMFIGMRSRSLRKAWPVALGGMIAMLAVVQLVTDRELSDPEAARFSGIQQRVTLNADAYQEWRTHPVTGAGIRYFTDPSQPRSEAHNVVYATLAETGVVGLVALAALLGTAYQSVRRLPGSLATTARIVMAARVLAGLLDIFWVAGTGAIMWLIIGVAIGAHRRDEVTGSFSPGSTGVPERAFSGPVP